jgi:formylglycine-generating enzyme required for sulfatase activity
MGATQNKRKMNQLRVLFIVTLLGVVFAACRKQPISGELVGLPTDNLEKLYKKGYPYPKEMRKMYPLPEMAWLQWQESDLKGDSLLKAKMGAGLLLGITEVTNLQYCAFLNAQDDSASRLFEQWMDWGENPEISFHGKAFTPVKGYENHPARWVSFEGANAYCGWLAALTDSIRAGKGLASLPFPRLIHAQEWEICARYLSKGKPQAWTSEFSGGKPQAVMAPNSEKYRDIYGFFGNVSEWCVDSLQIERADFSKKRVSKIRYYYRVAGGDFRHEASETALIREGKSKDFFPETGFRVCATPLLRRKYKAGV